MKHIFLLMIVVWCSYPSLSQTRIEKKTEVASGQKVRMNFNHAKLITIKTWDVNEIQVVANVSINAGSNDDAFEVLFQEGETLRINSHIRNYEDLPENVIIRYQGKDYFFETDNINAPEIQKFRDEKGSYGYEHMCHGVITDIKLEVMVPKNISLEVYSKLGVIEIHDFKNELDVASKFGGIDVSVDDPTSSSLEVRVKFGDLYSNLDTKFTSQNRQEIGKWAVLRSNSGANLASQSFKSEFGNVYLRKTAN